MAEASPAFMHELLKQRLALLRALADSLELAQAAPAMATAERLDQHSERQRELCRQLSLLGNGFEEGMSAGAEAGLAGEVQVTARRVAGLNRNYAGLLLRRRRTADIFCRVLASSGTTYPAPKPPARADKGTRRAKE